MAGAAKHHYPWLDWMRFLAAFAVLLVHARSLAFVAYGDLPAEQQTQLVAGLFFLTRMGDEAVLTFFVLSGFLVGGRAVERLADGSFRPRDYILDRVSRIMTPLAPALVFAAIVGVLWGRGFDAGRFACNLASLQGVFCHPYESNVPLWSLAYEMWFYILVWIAGAAIIARRFSAWTVIGLALGLIVFTELDASYLFCWLVGAAAYGFRPNRPSVVEWLAALALLGIGTAGVQIGLDSDSIAVEELRAWVPPYEASQIIWSTGVALVIRQLLTLAPTTRRGQAIDAAGTRLAAFSYSLYLTHAPVMVSIEEAGFAHAPSLTLASVGMFFAVCVVCLGVAWLFYVAFERHTGAIRRWLKARRFSLNGRRAGAPAGDRSG